MLRKFLAVFISFAAAFTVTLSAVSNNEAYNTYAEAKIEVPYYYYQMSNDAKSAYLEIREAVLECKKELTLDVRINQADFDMIAELLILHDPITFNVSDIGAHNITRRSVTFDISYTYDKATFDKMSAAYEKRIDKVLAKLNDDMTTYEKIKKIHDLLINNAEYNVDAPNSSNIYGTIVKKKGKCDGYSKTFSYICSKAGIRTVTVIGKDMNSTDDIMHMWNKVYYKNKWYNVDVTWDDPVGNMTDNMTYNYFMVSDKSLKKTHSEDNGSFKAPEAADDSKSYYVVYKKYAEDLDSAKSIIKSELRTAAKKGKTNISLKCSSAKVYNSVKNYVLNTKNVSSVLNDVKKSKNSSLASDLYSYTFEDNQYIVKIIIFYNDTKIEKYFSTLDGISDDMLDILKKYGIE